MEEKTAKLRRDVQSLAKDIAQLSHQISSLENKIETKKNERHNVLRQCNMDDIPILLDNILQ
jgi:structural maintenance of chromosome 1